MRLGSEAIPQSSRDALDDPSPAGRAYDRAVVSWWTDLGAPIRRARPRCAARAPAAVFVERPAAVARQRGELWLVRCAGGTGAADVPVHPTRVGGGCGPSTAPCARWPSTPGPSAMALTGHLQTGALAAWCAANLPGTPVVAADVATTLAEVTADRPPVRPRHIATRDHWAAIGGALGQRLAFATQHAPPYYALLGAHRAGLADWATIQRCASRFPTHAGLGPDRATHANQMRPLPGDQWLDLDDTAAAELGGRSPTGTRPALLTPWPRKGRLRTTQL